MIRFHEKHQIVHDYVTAPSLKMRKRVNCQRLPKQLSDLLPLWLVWLRQLNYLVKMD